MGKEGVKASMMYAMFIYIAENAEDIRGFLKNHKKVTSKIIELVDDIDRDKTFNKLFKDDDNSQFVMFISKILDETESSLLNAVNESRLEEIS